MSRTRVVKGAVTKVVGKSYKIYSGDNIENYSAKKIIQIGMENGVSYGEPDSVPESPMIYGENPTLKGEVIFCNGFHSSPIGAANAAFNITLGQEDKPWYIPDGDNTHHKEGEIGMEDVEAQVIPSDLDKDIMSSSEIIEAEGKPKEEIALSFDWNNIPFGLPIKLSKRETTYKKELQKFKGYWNDYTNFNQALDLYTTFFNANNRDNYINGSHGMGSPAWERECHGISLGYHWAVRNWKLKSKAEVEQAKENNPNAESYSPAYRPLTFVGHSEGAAVAVGACIGAMYYAAEKGWDEMAVNLILLGIHQPVALWSDEPYDANRAYQKTYETDYNSYKWFKTEVLEVGGNSPRILNELYANATKVENAVTPFGPALAHIFTKDRNKQRFGIDEWTQKLLGTENWDTLKKRAVQFTFANDRADTVMLDGDIPGIANAKGDETDCSLFGWKTWLTYSAGFGGMNPGSDTTINVLKYDKGFMNTRIKVSESEPDRVTYLPTTYKSWVEEFCKYHKIFKEAAVKYEKKYKEHWETGKENIRTNTTILFNPIKANDYAIVAAAHRDMMVRYVWMHHVELEAHFAPVGYINRSEIFNKHDGSNSRDEENWPEAEGKTIWHRILKTSDKNDVFYRINYSKNKDIFYEKDIVNIKQEFAEIKKDITSVNNIAKVEKEYVNNNKSKLINPQMALTDDIAKWVNIAKLEITKEDEKAQKERERLEKEHKRLEWELEKASNIWPGPKI